MSLLIRYAEILLLLVSLYIVFLVCKSWDWRKGRESKLPTNWPVIGVMPWMLLNLHRAHEYLTDVLQSTGMTFEIKGPWFSNVNMLITCDPANVHYILSKRFLNFPKGPQFKRIFDILGDGIFNAESESWDIQRRTTMTLINHRGFQKFVVSTTWKKVEKGLIPVLEHVAKLGSEADLEDIIQRLTFDTTCILIVGHDPASLTIDLTNFPYKQAFADAEEAVLYRHVFPEIWWKLQRWLQIGSEKKLSRAQMMMDEFLANCISSKSEQVMNKGLEDEEQQEAHFDFLTGYMKTLEEKISGSATTDPIIPEKIWRDTMLNLIFAGKDTIGATLTWFFWLLAKNPIEEYKIRQEMLNNLRSWNISDDIEDIKKLTYLHGALCEALRLFPPVWLQHKAPIEEDILPSGHRIKPNTKTVLSFYSMGRMDKIWGGDCLEFKPERWISEAGRIKHVPSFKFTAFNAGPRSCLGKEMSFLQMKIIAAAVLLRFQIKVVEGHPISPSTSVILDMKHGFKVRVFSR